MFEEIRPYHDEEVPSAVARLVNDPEFLHAIVRYRLGAWAQPLEFMLLPVVSFALKRHFRKFQTVDAIQRYIARYMDIALKRTTKSVTSSGLEHLDPAQSYLFISNHRDIAMDPALVNWCLHHAGHQTARIAIGDNLLKKPCVTELMRLNKSFIVRRSAKGPREMLKALGQLSGYIKHSLETGHSIWIAQKEGRAKDGFDQTDPAILKMFHMEGRQRDIDFATYMNQLQIVPVSISYEFDPCDEAKARELALRAQQGSYEKAELEDIESIIAGITGYKGRVHVHFGKVVTHAPAEPDALAKHIDADIYQGYRLYPINLVAADQPVAADDYAAAEARLNAADSQLQPFLRQMYAQTFLNHFKEVL